MELTTFTPLLAAAGGLLVAASATLLMLGLGRIAGISGMLASATRRKSADRAWPAVFLVSMVAAAGITFYLAGFSFTPRQGFSTVALVLGGLLVGYGTAMGSGCTSGHGVCGLARLSPRSLVATAVFMTTAIVVVWVVRHLLGPGA
ncbi:YeeE/YedE family protein [Marinihelvus fidelis]|uniref:YeeE/YedE family protein n=1 Tax=Marinihelvus fidelis TaxID=2613842 RepID=A0A5N0TCC6_9GAMM|nr:YeeE/YedE thiosulfate transporter family protein [Marinihelvus fidelis]KAA9131486.1 YeeE/YedE family protein [Marinihelvus fidelis]